MITDANLTQLQIVTLRQELALLEVRGCDLSDDQRNLLTACQNAWSGFETDDVLEAKQTIADYLNAKRGEVTAETVTDEQIRELRAQMWHDCCRALADGLFRDDQRDPDARARCAAYVNVRNASVWQ